jgi:Tfp pilus assembly protein PilF
MFAVALFATSATAQPITLAEWNAMSIENKRLLPKYGHKPKSASEVVSDRRFIAETMALPQFANNARAASNHVIGLGFEYLYRGDLKTAMYRFNQAYLLDSTNTDIHWGYGAIYMTLEDYQSGRKQYLEGLALNSTNTHLLTDYSTYLLAQFFILHEMPDHGVIENKKEQETQRLDSALHFLLKSYRLDPKDQSTAYKLSTVYYYKDDCVNATKYLNESKKLGGRNVTKAYTDDLKKKCR